MPREIADRHLELLCDRVAPALRRSASDSGSAPGGPGEAVSVV
jgi:hypothetical protein